jgi:asparagine synthase (glutamine-hydrolysing)
MLDRMRHRGPDDGGVYSDDVVTLGQRRLAIIDTSPAGHQPMPDATGKIQLVLNGEIYSFLNERALLEKRGRRFASHSDTEVVLALYEAYGEGFVERLRGIFALGLYDARGGPGREKLILVRDHFGIKPLLYAEIGGGLVFASELKAILSSGYVPRAVDPAALRQLLSLGSVYQPRTLVAGVRNLPSAHMMIVDRNGARVRRYWSYGRDRVKGLRSAPYLEQVEAVHEAIRASVRLQMVADVPVGAFLSGGVDSSLIVAMMAREAGDRVKTFSVGFESGAGAVDESHEAAEIAGLLGTDHTRVVVTRNEIAGYLDRFVSGLDQPSVDGLNSFFVSEAAARSVTVSLSGTGGDDVFLGYPWFAHILNRFDQEVLTAPEERKPSWLGRVRGWAFGEPRRKRHTPDRGPEFREAFGALYHCCGPTEADALLSPTMRAAAPPRAFADDLSGVDELPYAEPADRAAIMCLNGYTRNQLLRDIDACAMSHSLEVRVPFLDPVVADHALSLPLQAKMRFNERTLDPSAGYDQSGVKRVVCDVARRYLPPFFFADRAKKGFNLPIADWLRGPLACIMAEALSPETVKARGLFEPPVVEGVRRAFLRGERPWNHPWILMITELWHRSVLLA